MKGFIALVFLQVNDKQKISKMEFVYDDLYSFKRDPIATNPNIAKPEDYTMLPLEKDHQEWEAFLASWAQGKETDMFEFHGGMEPDCIATINGQAYSKKEPVYAAVKKYLDASAKHYDQDNPFPLQVTVQTSPRGRMTAITIREVSS